MSCILTKNRCNSTNRGVHLLALRLMTFSVTAARFGALSESVAGRRHTHPDGQLVLSLQGVVACEARDAHWIIPPHCALWLPAGLPHVSRASPAAEGCFVFIHPSVTGLPDECRTLRISPMLREIIVELANRPPQPGVRRDALMVELLIEELAIMERVDTHFPIPRHPRIRQIAQALIASPGDRRTVEEWSRHVGMGERTLSRRLFEETGMSFGKWRRQLHLMVALEALAKGRSVQQVSDELGYEAVTSFINMFKQALGTTPAKYRALQPRP
ncbi:hypothetical protein BED46_009935 [Burkholderia contaminans]|nr:hypothetical protein BGI28_00415 [Burkholderia contaminans]OMI84423.1 hypothetical protein BED46_009935 [Burkholderia contaminans]